MHSGSLTLNFSPIFGSSLCRASRGFLFSVAIIAILSTFAPPAAAQEHWPMGAIARFTGDDISFEGSTLGGAVPGGTSFFISSGTVLTVHSGDARLTLPGGGTVDICGPAKLTLLESNNAYTVALNFGRVHVRLADPTQLHVFTPFVMATPVSIAEEARDFTIGLDINDAMCVFAAQGAARLEDQFSSEGLVVPQLGEFFLSGEKLQPVGGPAGTCRCYRDEARAIIPPRPIPTATPQPQSAPPAAAPVTAQSAAPAPQASSAPPTAAPTHVASSTPPTAAPTLSASAIPPPSAPAATKIPPAAASKPKAPSPSAANATQQPPPAIAETLPRATSVIPTVHADEPPPPPAPPPSAPTPPANNAASAPAKQINGTAPEADNGFTMPEHANESKPVATRPTGAAPTAPQVEPPVRVVMPPLAFSAANPNPPLDPNPQLVTLIREARVTSDWVFTGHVAETKSPAAASFAQSEPTKSTPSTRRHRRGILTMFKRFFGSQPPPPKQ